MDKLNEYNMIFGTVAQFEVSIYVDPESQLPFVVTYEIIFADRRFKNFIKDLNYNI